MAAGEAQICFRYKLKERKIESNKSKYKFGLHEISTDIPWLENGNREHSDSGHAMAFDRDRNDCDRAQYIIVRLNFIYEHLKTGSIHIYTWEKWF